jgi:hypothetical protein
VRDSPPQSSQGVVRSHGEQEINRIRSEGGGADPLARGVQSREVEDKPGAKPEIVATATREVQNEFV